MSKFSVCPECDGEGSMGTLGAFTADEMAESFDSHDDYVEAHEYSKRPCSTCKGLRVVTAERMAEVQEEREYAAEVAAEQRYGY